MIRRFYVHNFRCLENFELPIRDQSSVLLIGNNGSGKTAVSLALEILQKIARGTNRVSDLVRPKDLSRGRTSVPARFAIEVDLNARVYEYAIAFELDDDGSELRVLEEKLTVDGQPVYTRQGVRMLGKAVQEQDMEAGFGIHWHLVALPIIEQSRKDPLFVFSEWLRHMLILRPIPSLITGDSTGKTLEPDPSVTNFGAWFSGVLAYEPAAYGRIEAYLRQVMPDLRDIKNPATGKDSQRLEVYFTESQGTATVPFADLSDGEKCFMICALVLAASDAYGPLFCFWDEPDAHLAMSEVGHFVLALRKAFKSDAQFIMTSHDPEAIRRFSDENTLVLYRKSHLEPTIVRPLKDIKVSGDLINALIRGDVEPDERQSV